jgi:hypothetical protein
MKSGKTPAIYQIVPWSFLVVATLAGCGKKDAEKPSPAPGGGPAKHVASTWDWTDYSSKTDGFTVKMPWGPPRPIGVGQFSHKAVKEATNYSTNLWGETNEQGLKHQFTMTVAKFTPNARQDAKDEAVDKLAESVGGTSKMTKSAPRTVTWAGQPATETEYESEAQSDGKKRRVVIRRLVTPSTFYLGMVKDGGNLTPKDLEMFFDSFQLTKT